MDHQEIHQKHKKLMGFKEVCMPLSDLTELKVEEWTLGGDQEPGRGLLKAKSANQELNLAKGERNADLHWLKDQISLFLAKG